MWIAFRLHRTAQDSVAAGRGIPVNQAQHALLLALFCPYFESYAAADTADQNFDRIAERIGVALSRQLEDSTAKFGLLQKHSDDRSTAPWGNVRL